MPLLILLCSLAMAAGPKTTASQAALSTFLGPGEHPDALREAQTTIDAALASEEVEDPDTWVQALRVYGHLATVSGGDAEAADRLLKTARRANDRKVDPERIAREVQKVSLKLTRLAMTATLDARRNGTTVDTQAAYGWARKALELDALSEELGAPIPAQHASTLSVAASTALDAGEDDAALEHYRQLRLMGQKDNGVSRRLATAMAAEQGPDAAVAWLQADLAEERDDLALLDLAAELFIDADRPHDAVLAVQPYMAVFEQVPEAWLLYGRTQEAAGRLDEARASLDRCLAITPDAIPCLWARARVPFREGAAVTVVAAEGRKAKRSAGYGERRRHWKEAVFYLERAWAIDPDHLQVKAALLTIYTDFGDRSKLQELER